MRKHLRMLLPSLLLVATWFSSCKKETSHSPDIASDNPSQKVNAWLDLQRSPNQLNTANPVDSLKGYLDYAGIKYEPFIGGDQLIVIPVKEAYKLGRNVDKNTLVNLVLVANKSDSIKWGRISLYVPEAGTPVSTLPANTLSKVLSTQPTGLNGMFRLLSVKGKRLQEYGYKNGKFYSYGQVQNKKKAAASTGARTEEDCIDWYLVTTFYVDGVQVFQSEEYVGTTCGGVDQGGGGGGSNPPALQEDVTETEDQIDDTDGPIDNPDGNSSPDFGGAPKITYVYTAHIVRVEGMVTSAYAYPTTISNNFDVYVDRYGRGTTRSLLVFGTIQSAIPAGATALCSWFCSVWGSWVYSNGNPPYSKVWSNSHSTVR